MIKSLAFLFLSIASLQALATDKIAIIIDDMGNKHQRGIDMINLPGQLTYSFLPHTPFAQKLANLTHTRGKDVMLHMPMQPYSNLRLGPGGLTVSLDEDAFRQRVEKNLNAVPHIVGVNNHMGSRLTQDKRSMQLVMQGIREIPHLFFVDSRTTRETIAQRTAMQYDIPSSRRDIFLDHDIKVSSIRKQFHKLIKHAKKHGYATAIGHPHAETLQVLAEELPLLEQKNIQLIPMSRMIALQQRNPSWQKPSSPSLKVAKSSKQSQ